MVICFSFPPLQLPIALRNLLRKKNHIQHQRVPPRGAKKTKSPKMLMSFFSSFIHINTPNQVMASTYCHMPFLLFKVSTSPGGSKTIDKYGKAVLKLLKKSFSRNLRCSHSRVINALRAKINIMIVYFSINVKSDNRGMLKVLGTLA